MGLITLFVSGCKRLGHALLQFGHSQLSIDFVSQFCIDLFAQQYIESSKKTLLIRNVFQSLKKVKDISI